MRKGLVLLALLAAMPNALAPTISAQAADSSYLSLVRRLVSDSLRGAGRRAGERFFASDSATRALLKASGVIGASMERPPPVMNCPVMRLSGAEASPVGYKVDVRESPGADSARKWVEVTVSCSYPHRAPFSGRFSFFQSCRWELRRTTGGWTIAGRESCRIT